MSRDNCANCAKKSNFEGCAHIECPMRKAMTAQPTGQSYIANSTISVGGFAVPASWGFRKEPTTKDES